MPETDSNVLLTDLCGICHTHAIKYTCPRCGIHTCSLPCVKRHKSWAQCSGVRDPAAYRKRNDLTTATSIDQDFNFITSVERSLQSADDKVVTKGIDLVPGGLVRNQKTKFDTEVHGRGVRIIKAPPGLSRHKQNRSQWRKGLLWTVEWVCYSGEVKLANVQETKTVEEAFVGAFGSRTLNLLKRRHSEADQSMTTKPTKSQRRKARAAGQAEKAILEGQEKGEDTAIEPQSSVLAKEKLPDPGDSHDPKHDDDNDTSNPQSLHFYLFKANTTSKVKCLIPVSAQAKLVDVLRNQTVLEFPTFYARQEAPDGLPAPFITEEAYNEQFGTDVGLKLPTYAPDEDLEDGEIKDLNSIDEKKVLEVLRRDLNG